MVGVLRGLNKNGIWAGPPVVALASLAVLYVARWGKRPVCGVLGGESWWEK